MDGWWALLLADSEGPPVSALAMVGATLVTVIGLLVWVVRHLLTDTIPKQQDTFSRAVEKQQETFSHSLERLLERMERQGDVTARLAEAVGKSQIAMDVTAGRVEELYEDFWIYLLDPNSRPSLAERKRVRDRKAGDHPAAPPPTGPGPGRTTV